MRGQCITEWVVGRVTVNGKGAPLGVTDVSNARGPMLVRYFNLTQPGGPDDPNPPPLVSREWPYEGYLAFIARE